MQEEKDTRISRRSFLTGAAATGAIAAASAVGLAGCTTGGGGGGNEQKPAETTPAETTPTTPSGPTAQKAVWSWEIPEDTITDFVEEKPYDVIVVGCGLAGMSAAVAAAQQGAKVAVLEKTDQPNVRGLHVAAVDTSAQRAAGITINKYQSARDLIRWSGKRVKEELHWLFINNSGRAIDWCFDICKEKNPEMYLTMWDACYRGEDYYENPGATHIFSGGPLRWNNDIADCMVTKGEALGVDYFYEMPGVQLVKDGDFKVTGIVAGEPGNYTKFNGTVILATGDFGGNDEMIDCYLPWVKRVHQKIYTPVDMNTGDGHIMGMRAGASMQAGAHAAMIHPQVGGPVYCFLRVNKNAERYENEDISAIGCSTSIMMQPDQIAWCVYDGNFIDYLVQSLPYGGGLMWDQVMREWGAPFNREQEMTSTERNIERGNVVTADTIEGLAAAMEIDPTKFKATVDRYNEVVKAGVDEDFGKRKELLFPILEPPFYASHMMTGLLTIPTGLSINSKMQVLGADFVTPFEGLYAVGNVGGDFFAQDYPTIFPGHSHGRAITFGRIGGSYAAGMAKLDDLYQ
ncbi:MAG: FAD-dependent oxidoreductase [Coriobacteriia bacterium]|nr:FAD-dependent oxidoreductase [Coriobacteriia bacterium]